MDIEEITSPDSLQENQFDKDWFDSVYEECFVDLSQKYDRPETVISIGENEYKGKPYPTSVMTAGEFSVISAPSKTKKSFLKSQFSASYIGGEAQNYFPSIKGHRTEEFAIIDCDTEQSKYYSARTFKRTIEIAGQEYSNYFPFKMRHLSPEERVAFIDNLLENKKFKDKVKLVFIDGVADLIEDSNDLVMSNYVAGKLLKWTDVYNIHVCVVIHNAYNTIKPTGHLGSAVVKKAESVILLTPMDDEKEIIEVKHLYSRGMAFKEFYFRVVDALPYECDISGNVFHDKSNKRKDEFNEEPKPLPTMNPHDAFGNVFENDNDFQEDKDVPF